MDLLRGGQPLKLNAVLALSLPPRTLPCTVLLRTVNPSKAKALVLPPPHFCL